jgi:hypothetical protein
MKPLRTTFREGSPGSLTRRDTLRLGLGAAGGLLVPRSLVAAPDGGIAAGASPAEGRPARARARSVIQVWLWGGPSHLDTFDPKPEAGSDYCGPLGNPLATNVAGIRIGELLPELAKCADRYALIRGMTHGVFAHETAAYVVQTGRMPGDRQVFPSAGAVVSLCKGYEAGYRGLIPPYVVLTEPQGRFSDSGFLGVRHKPFATGGDPARTPFLVEGIVAPGISTARQRSRRELLANLNTLAHAMRGDPRLQALARCEQEAYELILGDAGKVFELAGEPADLRDRYGRSTFGQSCLLARRLVESGVPYVTINSRGWDTHKQHFQAMRRMLPDLDRGLATLLKDLADRGLLESTIVWCGGEFGRTPKVQNEAPWNGGRGHWGRVFSTLVAGGGFRGGVVVGASDPKGLEVAERPVHPADLLAAIYELLGIDAGMRLPHPEGAAVTVLPPPAERQGGGRLVEVL